MLRIDFAKPRPDPRKSSVKLTSHWGSESKEGPVYLTLGAIDCSDGRQVEMTLDSRACGGPIAAARVSAEQLRGIENELTRAAKAIE
jgi:hypothetical protein